MDKITAYSWNVIIALDQLANTVAGGDPDETISSRAGKKVRQGHTGPWRWLCLLLNKFDRNHCRKNIEDDEGQNAVIK